MTSFQVAWYTTTARAVNVTDPAPSIAFFHIPTAEYITALFEGNVTGHCNEKISVQPVDPGLFSAFLERQDVKVHAASGSQAQHTTELRAGDVLRS